jgi:hypothetical protein
MEGPPFDTLSADIELHVSLINIPAAIGQRASSPNEASFPVCVTLQILTTLVGMYSSKYLYSKLASHKHSFA